MKLTFESDYNNGAHPALLQHLLETNNEKSVSYGFDVWSLSAKEKIKKACDDPEAQITFLGGGTQTNATVIAAMLREYEGVVCVDSGHIGVHEAGAVEGTGHKVLTMPAHNGKMTAEQLEQYLAAFHADENAPHCVWPGMVYITFPTEYGTLYTAKELSDIYEVCKKYHLPLYVDGARLGYGLMAPGNDVDLPYLSHHCDAFYIGGTKMGALCGEAIVFTHNNEPAHFFTTVKRHCALFAKGRLIGVQFDALFTDNLYLRLGQHGIDTAVRLKKMLTEAGFKAYIDSPTNQQFVIIPTNKAHELMKKVAFEIWGPYNENESVCRFVTSWATTDEELDELEKILKEAK
ncbi:MAG: threonine aldolase family protein [Prevotella sp.]|jgi:threonine aldolase